ncbi:hypothetical protein JAAARDRAFT_113076, partial [Jaapia argillacea MUCL 33604]
DLRQLDSLVAQLIGALEVSCEETSAKLGSIVEDVSRSVPRLSYDIHFMREGAISLQDSLSRVQAISSVQGSELTATALDRIHFLHNVKDQMVAARAVLQEAESWSSLDSEVTSLLGDHKYDQAAERLSDASKSMFVFQNTVEYDARHTLMVSLQNQLEASLSSALVAAINDHDIATCRRYFSIFTRIQREAEFRDYYIGSRRGPVVTQWSSFSTDGSESFGRTYAESLTAFYATFLSVIRSESLSIPLIFPDPQATMSNLIVSTLSALRPTFTEHLTSLSSQGDPRILLDIIAAFLTTEGFALEVTKVISSMGAPNMATDPNSFAMSSLPQKQLTRRHSHRSSISGRVGTRRLATGGTIFFEILLSSASQAQEWDVALFEPFVDTQVDYASMERRYLDASLQEASRTDSTSTLSDLDPARRFNDKLSHVLSMVEEASARCRSFTHGFGSVSFIQVVDGLVASFVDSVELEFFKAPSSFSADLPSALVSRTEDFSDMDYTTRDWSNIQRLLHLLDAARTASVKISGYEKQLRATLAQTFMSLELPVDGPNSRATMTAGEAHLLVQSTLNSAELQSLIKLLCEPQAAGSDPSSTFLHGIANHRAHAQGPSILPTSRESVSKFSRACQKSLQDTILSPLRKHLSNYSSSPQWAIEGDGKTKAVGGVSSDLRIPLFSLSPSDTVQRVAEGLLNLPRLFEVYADDDALAFSIETLPFLASDVLKAMSETSHHGTTASASASSRLSPSISSKQALQGRHISPEGIVSAWLSALALALLSYLTDEVLPAITTLTGAGAAQLASDLAYLGTIVRALNVEYPDLERWKECVGMEDAEGQRYVMQKPTGDVIFNHVARMRGWH